MLKFKNNILDNYKTLKSYPLNKQKLIESFFRFYSTAIKKPILCVVETSGNWMYCIQWPVMTQLKKVFILNQLNYYAHNRKTPTDRCH